MPVSIKDIARLAGVSHSTVSRALRDSPLIPAATAQRIQQIARESGYTASAVARSLVTRKTQAIGVVVTSIADPFNGDLVDGIEEVANQHGYSVILATSQADPEREMAVVRSFGERRVDGILVASSRVGSLYLPMLEELKIPIVLVNNQHRSDFAYSIAVDNVHGAYQAARHLIELGHRRIGYLGDRLGLHSDEDRFAGFGKALAEFKVSLPKEFVVYGDGKLEGASIAARDLLHRSKRPTAVLCYNDISAFGLLKVAEECGIMIPESLSVTGFDDITFAALARPALTTVRQPRREMGRKAAELLIAIFNGSPEEKALVIRGELIVRESTAPLSAS
ncbi:MAG: LacI family DNA-binding transcriptional regulator [Acidobacteriaceae bacterium]|nr:LacI family DNA-binding transcriptional regulator [Acidobacteriaceae bacterium]MBV9225968.1 LacI family DNA-binding transcriptional regulator [Acidobacteriaceae bacterium]MBV9306109.1 LacI family DNA-binding transcriptional regulator [Acidobacteriaceae bacterium]MBV9675562.1 LacI family DNA-binding transcriptional regulator [Acidobacteriaceae bacterium]MBV9937404.1 LacI family DNA-binding transcriptional regulator [Acidobacteriaceae bacterium]